MVMKEKDEELVLFMEMRRREKENERINFLLLPNSDDEVDASHFEFSRDSVSSENDKSDYDWLLTPPATPLFPTLEKESQISVKSETQISKAHPTALKPRETNIQTEPASRRNVASKTHLVMPSLNSSTNVNTNRRPSSSSPSRSSTPFGRPTLPSTAKSSRPFTPTSRATLTSAKPVRSSTPTRSSSASKIRPALAKNPMKSRVSSLDAPPNLKASLPERPASTSRSSRLSSLEANNNNNSSGKSRRLILRSRSCLIDGGDNDSPVMVGTKMVERIVNMRKLAPPKLEADHHSAVNNSSGKFSVSDSSGFGRTLSNKSLDMAMRHMDIRRSIQDSLKPLVTSIPASSMYSVRSSGLSKSSAVSASDSPLAASSTCSSEPSVNNSSLCYNGNEIE